MVLAPPFRAVSHHLNEQTRTNMSALVRKHCGIGNIARHYVVGDGSVLCRPLFILLLVSHGKCFQMGIFFCKQEQCLLHGNHLSLYRNKSTFAGPSVLSSIFFTANVIAIDYFPDNK